MRKSKPKKRRLRPDPKFKSELVTRFVNNLMYDGKKSISYDIFYDAIQIVADKTSEDGLEIWHKALENVTPNVEVRTRRVGGANFPIPMEIRPSRKTSMGMKFLINFARKRNDKSMSMRLANEIIAASKNEGAAVKRKEEIHRMAEANKAFAHFKVK
jgi:small subunit ribosomal protein S7